MPKLEVFVSHRTVEAKFADALRTHLSRDFIGIVNFFVSTDVTSVPAGSQWFDTLLAGLQRAHLLLVICSNESVGLPWINYETGGACARNVDVITRDGLFHGLPIGRCKVAVAVSTFTRAAICWASAC